MFGNRVGELAGYVTESLGGEATSLGDPVVFSYRARDGDSGSWLDLAGGVDRFLP